MSVSTEDPPHFAQGRRPVRHIAQTKRNGHDIEAAGRKRQLERIGHYRVRQALAPRHGQHFRAKIGARDFRFRHLPRDRQGEIAAPGGKIEHPPRTPFPNDVRGAPTPPEIEPAAEQMIGQIVTPGDPAEHGPNPSGSRSIRGLSRLGSDISVQQWTESRSVLSRRLRATSTNAC